MLIFPATSIARAEVTNLQFVINPFTSGGLSISVPTSETFTSMVTPSVSTDAVLNLETITVTDTRRSTGAGSWTTNAVASNLVSLTDTLTASTFRYASGSHLISFGTATVISATRLSMATVDIVEMATAILGSHVVTWRPTLTIPVPALKNPGTYVGTITHSLS